jgi:hypothetical protein
LWVCRHNIDAQRLTFAKLLNTLIEQNVLDISASDNIAFRTACHSGNREIAQMLLQDKRVDPAASNNNALRNACANNHASIVADLLNDDRIDPSMMSQAALDDALLHRSYDVLSVLLKDHRVDPSTCGAACIEEMITNSEYDMCIIRTLLNDKRVVLSNHDLRCIIMHILGDGADVCDTPGPSHSPTTSHA